MSLATSATSTASALGINLVNIPGGTFLMGSESPDSFANEQPTHEVTLSPFAIMETDATVAQYRTYVEFQQKAPFVLMETDKKTGLVSIVARVKDPGEIASYDIAEILSKSSGRIIEVDGNILFKVMPPKLPKGFDRPNQPITCVSFYEAVAFLAALNMRPITAAEYEYVATGPNHDHEYGTRSGKLSKKEAHYAESAPADVGSYPANEFDLFDICGNGLKWCLDRYGPYTPEPQKDPIAPPTGREREGRAGPFTHSHPRNLRAASRGSNDPVSRYGVIGVRGVASRQDAQA